MWFFTYGALMWRELVPVTEKKKATLPGYHRELCINAMVHRGTPELPGLVFGLKPGGQCRGVAFYVEPELWGEAKAVLDSSELIRDVYVTAELPIQLDQDDGSQGAAVAYCYLANPQCMENNQKLGMEEIVYRVSNAKGISGTNLEYIQKTVEFLRQEKIFDSHLEEILAATQK